MGASEHFCERFSWLDYSKQEDPHVRQDLLVAVSVKGHERGTLYFGCLPSLLPTSSCVLFLEYSLAAVRTACFRFLMWAEDQQLSRNCAGLRGQIGIVETSGLVNQAVTGFLTSPVWDRHCGITQIASCKHSNKSPINTFSYSVNSPSSENLTNTRGCGTPHLPLFLYTLAWKWVVCTCPQTRIYCILDCNL